MSACEGCGGRGYRVVGTLVSGEDDHEVECQRCGSSGCGPCPVCGERTARDAAYCSANCAAIEAVCTECLKRDAEEGQERCTACILGSEPTYPEPSEMLIGGRL